MSACRGVSEPALPPGFPTRLTKNTPEGSARGHAPERLVLTNAFRAAVTFLAYLVVNESTAAYRQNADGTLEPGRLLTPRRDRL